MVRTAWVPAEEGAGRVRPGEATRARVPRGRRFQGGKREPRRIPKAKSAFPGPRRDARLPGGRAEASEASALSEESRRVVPVRRTAWREGAWHSGQRGAGAGRRPGRLPLPRGRPAPRGGGVATPRPLVTIAPRRGAMTSKASIVPRRPAKGFILSSQLFVSDAATSPLLQTRNADAESLSSFSGPRAS